MLINFAVSNFLSFKDRVEFSMLPSSSQQHTNHKTKEFPFSVLRGSVFYGANASGKSNFFDAVEYLKLMVTYGNIHPLLGLNQFKLAEHNKISTFEVTFQINSNIYNYLLETSPNEVVFEKLVKWYKTTDSEDLIFERKGIHIDVGKMLENNKSKKNWYKERTFQKNMLFLTKLKLDGIIENQSIIKGSSTIIEALMFFDAIEVCKPDSILKPEIFYQLFEFNEYQSFLLNLLKEADTGITDIKWVELGENDAKSLWQEFVYKNPMHLNYQISELTEDHPILLRLNTFYAFYIKNNIQKVKTIKTFHGNDIPFELESESSGAKRLIDLSLAIYRSLKGGRITFIDELDCSLHPMLTKFLINTFFEIKTNSQLIISLHDINLLDKDIWRPDEVWFVEKQPNGASDIYSLNQFKPRFDKKIINDYCMGKYGAIPMIGKLRM